MKIQTQGSKKLTDSRDMNEVNTHVSALAGSGANLHGGGRVIA